MSNWVTDCIINGRFKNIKMENNVDIVVCSPACNLVSWSCLDHLHHSFKKLTIMNVSNIYHIFQKLQWQQVGSYPYCFNCPADHPCWQNFYYTDLFFFIICNINGRDVQRKNVVNNVDKSSLWAPWQNGPYKNTQNITKHGSIQRRNRH